MRALPIPTARPGTGNRLPTPTVRSAVVNQTVDLKPAGNTVALTTVADNPFESGKAVSVVTQASGGMAPAPTSMQSRRIQHGFMPGLGQSATEEKAKDPGAMDYLTTLTDAATNIYGSREQRRTEEARARQAAADAEARQAEAEAQRARADADRFMATVANAGRSAVDATSFTVPGTGGFRINWLLLGLGAAGIGAAIYLSKKRKK